MLRWEGLGTRLAVHTYAIRHFFHCSTLQKCTYEGMHSHVYSYWLSLDLLSAIGSVSFLLISVPLTIPFTLLHSQSTLPLNDISLKLTGNCMQHMKCKVHIPFVQSKVISIYGVGLECELKHTLTYRIKHQKYLLMTLFFISLSGCESKPIPCNPSIPSCSTPAEYRPDKWFIRSWHQCRASVDAGLHWQWSCGWICGWWYVVLCTYAWTFSYLVSALMPVVDVVDPHSPHV